MFDAGAPGVNWLASVPNLHLLTGARTIQPFSFAEADPGAPLAAWVERYWAFTVGNGSAPPPRHHVPPDGCSSLAVIMPAGAPAALVISGPWQESFAVPVSTGARYWGARLRPGALPGLLALNPVEHRNRAVPAPPSLAPLATQLLDRFREVDGLTAGAAVFDTVLGRYAERAQPPDRLVSEAVTLIRAVEGDARIGALAGQLGVSPRTLHRRFFAATGLSPKEFARIERLRRAAFTALARPDGPAWAQLAIEHGYADQAHLIHEFTTLTGLTPEAFYGRLKAIRHHNVRP